MCLWGNDLILFIGNCFFHIFAWNFIDIHGAGIGVYLEFHYSLFWCELRADVFAYDWRGNFHGAWLLNGIFIRYRHGMNQLPAGSMP